MGIVALRFSLPQIFPPSFPVQSTFQFYSVYQSFPYYSFFLSHYHKVICIFHSANYLSYFEVPKPFGNSSLVGHSLYKLNRFGDKQHADQYSTVNNWEIKQTLMQKHI